MAAMVSGGADGPPSRAAGSAGIWYTTRKVMAVTPQSVTKAQSSRLPT